MLTDSRLEFTQYTRTHYSRRKLLCYLVPPERSNQTLFRLNSRGVFGPSQLGRYTKQAIGLRIHTTEVYTIAITKHPTWTGARLWLMCVLNRKESKFLPTAYIIKRAHRPHRQNSRILSVKDFLVITTEIETWEWSQRGSSALDRMKSKMRHKAMP